MKANKKKFVSDATADPRGANSEMDAGWDLPDLNVRILRCARETVGDIVHAGEKSSPPRMSLFLEKHYPFFNDGVQSILLERHPEYEPKMANEIAYAVDAYLWAEQYGWIAYDNSADILDRDSQFIDCQAGFFLTRDLHWYSRLLTAIADDIERCIRHGQGKTDDATHEIRLQTWRNHYVAPERGKTIKAPTRWLEGTAFRANPDSMSSVRVTASKTSKERRAIWKQWLPCWKAEMRHLDQQCQFAIKTAARDCARQR